MALRNYVPIDFDDLPETFEYEIDNIIYQLSFNYNDEGDFYTCSIADDDGMIVSNEKLILNKPLFEIYVSDRLPLTPLVPMDESGQATKCGIDEFGDTVFLYEDDIDINEATQGSLPVDDTMIGSDY